MVYSTRKYIKYLKYLPNSYKNLYITLINNTPCDGKI